MKHTFLISLCAILISVQAIAQKKTDNAKPPVNYLDMPFDTQLRFTGTLGDSTRYWIGFDNKRDFDTTGLEMQLRQAAMHVADLKDSLKNPYTTKKLRIVVFADGKTVLFRLKETDNGKEMAYYHGTYLPLKTTYDTLEIVQLKKKTAKDDDEPYMLYTFSLKDINDLGDVVSHTSFADAKGILAKNVKRASGFHSKFYADVAFGAMVNSSIPVSPYLAASYYYMVDKNETGRGIVGLYLSANIGSRHDTVAGMTNIGIEFGSAKIENNRMVQKATIVLGTQFFGKQGKTDGPPIFFMGINLPATNNFSASLIIGTDFKYNYTDPNRRSNLGIALTYHL